jgi:hypothetical protein
MTPEEYLFEGMLIVAAVLFTFWAVITVLELAKRWIR